MRLVRTILAFAIAVSLAVLPLGATAGAHAMSSDGMKMADHADMSMDECCPDDMDAKASHTDSHKCGMGFCCIGGAIALGDVTPIAFGVAAVSAKKLAIPSDQVANVRGASPPFRPPRI
ncbi:hypothetical protein [Bradyrhizobium sp. SRS-191]|uniref:hypothetical protein n=1 Tax=Bradyrhizobium sp. SRS-191 TaxID=2962606 RepID=UPI00211E6516|nr:hypothetical protein [Bradyrhizobium sp. SRS-191]